MHEPQQRIKIDIWCRGRYEHPCRASFNCSFSMMLSKMHWPGVYLYTAIVCVLLGVTQVAQAINISYYETKIVPTISISLLNHVRSFQLATRIVEASTSQLQTSCGRCRFCWSVAPKCGSLSEWRANLEDVPWLLDASLDQSILGQSVTTFMILILVWWMMNLDTSTDDDDDDDERWRIMNIVCGDITEEGLCL